MGYVGMLQQSIRQLPSKTDNVMIFTYQLWFVPGGSAVAMLYEFKQPGLHVNLSHNLIVAIMLGAAAHVNVTGEWSDNLMEQVEAAGAIQ
ncbi:MAG TPA: hypothetical protein EYM38_04400 [Dehalococcoidia bacterium]|nr:hypothetical protein [Dehalococcoidia bacterium]